MDYKYSINAIRGLAMLGVFFFHMGLLPGAGYLPTLFIVMSGFFSVYGYDRYRNNFKGGYALTRLKKYYPMHLICFCGGIYIAISLHGSEIGKIFIKQCILYVFLLQTMFPKYCTAINAVEWTLSVLVICFFLTPFIVKLLPYLCKNNMSFAGIYILQLIYIFIFRNSASFIWFCGVAPFFRILDYIQGCMLAYLIMNGRIKPSNKFEIQSFIIYVFVVFVVAPKIENVFAWSLLFTPLSLCLINCFYSDCGFMSKYIFKFPIFQKLGSISFEFYMVHKLILEFWSQYIVNYILWGILSFGTAILVVVLYRHFLRVFTIS